MRLLSLEAVALLSCVAGSIATHSQDSVQSALDLERTLRGLGGKHDAHSAPMILVAGPISTTDSGTRQWHRLKRIHRHPTRIHRHPMLFRRGSRRHRLPSLPKAFVEVLKVHERVVVDEQNRPKHFEAAMSNDLMQIDVASGKMRLLMHGEMHIKPKMEGHVQTPHPDIRKMQQLRAASAPKRSYIINDYGVDGLLKNPSSAQNLLDRLIRTLHLNEFWPLFGFSMLCGFLFVGLIFITAKLVLSLVDDDSGAEYETVPTEEGLLASIDSAQPIRLENQMTEVSEGSTLLTVRDDESASEESVSEKSDNSAE